MLQLTSRASYLIALLLALFLAGCGSPPRVPADASIFGSANLAPSPQGQEVALYALTLKNIGYRFGGKNPEAGFDCSGMVTHVYRQALGMNLRGNAAALARQGREVAPADLRAGDLVFFNTMNQPFSHVGIYLGQGQFIHALNSRSGVRIDKMSTRYYATRFETARTMLD